MDDEQVAMSFEPGEPESREDAFERTAQEAVQSAQALVGAQDRTAEALVRIDLSGLAEGDPEVLTRMLRDVVRRYRRRRSRGARTPQPDVCVRWPTTVRAGRALRSAVEWRWQLLDREDPKRRLPTALVVERGATRLLGDLPPTLGGERVDRLTRTRLVTYHALRLGDSPGNSPKALGRLILRYARLGLVRWRGRLSCNKLEEFGVDPGEGPRGNVAVYESLLASAAGEKPLRLDR